jgi:site-specific DNA-cytosine methylase
MTYGSSYIPTLGTLCSGVGVAELAALQTGGYRLAYHAEIEPRAKAVLAAHFPDVPDLGDFTELQFTDTTPEGLPIPHADVLFAGTPCQDFSIAGNLAGIEGARGDVTMEWLLWIALRKPKVVVWENVPNVLSIAGGETFRAVLCALDGLGYVGAWRLLDARHYGVAQGRSRLFLVAYRGRDPERAARVLDQPCRRARDSEAHGEEEYEAPAGAGQGAAGSGGLGRVDAGQPMWRDGGDLSQCLDVSSLVKGQMMPEKNRFPVVMIPVDGSGSSTGANATTTGTAPSAEMTSPNVPAPVRRRRTNTTTGSSTGSCSPDVEPDVVGFAACGTSGIALGRNLSTTLKAAGGGGSRSSVAYAEEVASPLLANCGRTTDNAGKTPKPQNLVVVEDAAAVRYRARRLTIEEQEPAGANTHRSRCVGNAIVVPIAEAILHGILEEGLLDGD